MHQSINAPTTDEAGHFAARFAIAHSYSCCVAHHIACTLRARFSPLFKTALTPTAAAAAAAAAAAEVREADV